MPLIAQLSRQGREPFWLLVLMLVGVSLASCLSGCPDPERREPVAVPPQSVRPSPIAPGAGIGASQAPVGESVLRMSEALGGHTLQKHVGRSDAELIERLRAEPRISASSSFTDEATAELVVRAAIAQNQSAIEGWLSEGASRRLPLEYRGDTSIGRGIRRGEPEVGPRTGAHVVLERSGARGSAADDVATSPPYHVLTAYPQ